MVFGALKSAVDYHDYIMDTYGDPRVKDWLFMSGPLPTTAMCLTYIAIVKYIGPKLMEKREPFQLKKVLIVYNASLVIFSSWLVREGYYGGWFNGYNLTCQPCDYSTSPQAMTMTRASWFYFASKFVEFLDTFFFILRKKNNQVSTLHVIHHAVMPFSCWWGVKLTPGGSPTFFGLLNSFVHVIMYSYYLLAAMGPAVQKYLFWKKYLTILQIVQFVLIFIHAIILLSLDCDIHPAYSVSIAAHTVLFVILFRRFYKEAYLKGDKSNKEAMLRSMNMCTPSGVAVDQEVADQSTKRSTSETDVRKRVLPSSA